MKVKIKDLSKVKPDIAAILESPIVEEGAEIMLLESIIRDSGIDEDLKDGLISALELRREYLGDQEIELS